MASRFLAAAACSLLITEAAVLSQQPAAQLEDRLRDYIARFEQEASALVAEEDYVQRLVLSERGMVQGHNRRRLRSDYVLVKPADTGQWLGYRDTFEVDGHAVRDRDDRLVALLSSTAPDSRERAARFVNESARFNLGPHRTVNVPTLPIQLMARRNAKRFEMRVPRGWENDREAQLRFEEIVRPTYIRTPEGGNVEASGTVRVRVSDGAMLEAHLEFKFSDAHRGSSAGLQVRFAEVPGISVPVPIQMSDRVSIPGGGATGIANYSKYRRFQTAVRIR